MDRPAALLFDLDDTLISAYANRSAAWRAHLKDYGEALHPRDSAEVAEAIASAAAQFWSGPRATAQNRHDLRAVRRANVSNAFAHLGIDDTGLSIEIADRFTEKRRAGHRLYPETVPLLQTCRALGLKTGLVTNGGKDEQRAKLSRFDLGGLFDCVTISEEVGIEKPDPAIFHHALSALGVEATAAWMVGDNLDWDMVGAQTAGIAAVWLNVENRPLPETIRPDATISSLGEVLTLLDDVSTRTRTDDRRSSPAPRK